MTLQFVATGCGLLPVYTKQRCADRHADRQTGDDIDQLGVVAITGQCPELKGGHFQTSGDFTATPQNKNDTKVSAKCGKF